MARAPAKKEKSPDPSELKIALDNRAFEIQLFWQRSNYFLVLITALGIGVFSIREREFAVFVSFAATISSYLWFRTNLGSRFWQESWEAEVVLLANEMKIRSFERPTFEIVKQVESVLNANQSRSWIRKWVDRQILQKPSVSYQMIKLSLAFTILWFVVSLILVWKLRATIMELLKAAANWAYTALPCV